MLSSIRRVFLIAVSLLFCFQALVVLQQLGSGPCNETYDALVRPQQVPVETALFGSISALQGKKNCTVSHVGLGRWTYEHIKKKTGGFRFQEAKVETAQWTPLDCTLPHFAWNPQGMQECALRRGIRSIAVLGGSTSAYLLADFINWLQNNGNAQQINFHSKKLRQGANVDGLDLQPYFQTSADPTVGSWEEFLQNAKHFRDTLVIFNSGLWDMRNNDLEQYKLNVEHLAQTMSEYARAHPTNRVIWRASGIPSWERLDLSKDRARAKERLLNPDNVFTYNAVAARAMSKYGIEVFDDTLIVLGRPEETRGETDGLHPSTHLNLQIMKILLSVICAE